MLNCTSLNSAIFGNCNEYALQDRAELGKKTDIRCKFILNLNSRDMFAIISMLLKNLILRISSNSNVKYSVTILRTKGP